MVDLSLGYRANAIAVYPMAFFDPFATRGMISAAANGSIHTSHGANDSYPRERSTILGPSQYAVHVSSYSFKEDVRIDSKYNGKSSKHHHGS